MKKIYTLIMLLFWTYSIESIAQLTSTISGKVIDSATGEELPGALLKIDNTSIATVTNEKGEFNLSHIEGEFKIICSYLGFKTAEFKIIFPSNEPIIIRLSPEGLSLSAVEIVSTGYQEIPKERATGSFVQLDKELVRRRITPNFLDRLEDITPGLTFNRGGNDPISIRGRNTLFANNSPLVVIDNFPYDGPLENINPNDIETITVLRDAAAASIWGAQAGNGVIVITTKTGGFNSPIRVDITSNYSFTDRPDAFYPRLMGSNQYIEIEKGLFQRGFYNATENSLARAPLSPVIETLIDLREGRITQAQADERINNFAGHDIRNEFNKYMYRPRVHQQHAITISGGSQNSRYSIGAGFDQSISELVGNDNDRITMSFKNENKFLNEKLLLNTSIYLVKSNLTNNSINPATLTMQATGAERLFPYAKLRNDQGDNLPITYEYRENFVLQAEQQGLLNWQFNPLQEIELRNNTTDALDLRLNLGLDYKVNKDLTIAFAYQFWQNESLREQLNPLESYFTRNLINRFTQVGSQGLSFPIPKGDIIDRFQNRSYSHQLRTVARYNKTWNNYNQINAIVGAEIRDLQSEGYSNRFFGFNRNTGATSLVDPISFFNLYHFPSQVSRIPVTEGISGNVERFISYYANVGYTYKNKYLLSASARKDASNIFGVDTNLRGVPLWSLGAGWIISGENFYTSGALPFLKLRFTQGYNGNVDRSLSAQTTAQIFGDSFLTGRPFARIQNPPNPTLRWERIGITNIALDFETKNTRVSGTVEYYNKNGIDLIGQAPFAPSSGVSVFRGNIASTNTKGMDLNLQSQNIRGDFNWTSNFILSLLKEKVTDYEIIATPSQYLTFGAAGAIPYPLEGRPLYAVYAMPWAGLNPDNGNPMGLLDGEPSENYAAIFANTSADDLIYFGPARPTFFGAVRNTLSYKDLSLSFTFSFRGGHYYRRESIIYGSNRGLGGHEDYNLRWQQPGDELISQVPSVPELTNANRDNLYRFSEHLIERGDHVRFRDIRLGYQINKTSFPRLPVQHAEVFFYGDNLGILWKASDDPLDPDFRNLNPLKNFSFGLNLSF